MDYKNLLKNENVKFVLILCLVLAFAYIESERYMPVPEIAKYMRQEMQQELATLPPFPGAEDIGAWNGIIKTDVGGIGHSYQVSTAVLREYQGNQQQELVGEGFLAFDKPLRDYYYQQLLQRGWENVENKKSNTGAWRYQYKKGRAYEAVVITSLLEEGSVRFTVIFSWDAR